MRKVKTFVKYPSELDLCAFIPNSRYELYGVLIHEGFSLNSGHYYSYVKNNNRWFLMNDSMVESTKESIALNQKPYILFYKKKGREVIEKPLKPVITESKKENITENKKTNIEKEKQKDHSININNTTTNKNLNNLVTNIKETRNDDNREIDKKSPTITNINNNNTLELNESKSGIEILNSNQTLTNKPQSPQMKEFKNTKEYSNINNNDNNNKIEKQNIVKDKVTLNILDKIIKNKMNNYKKIKTNFILAKKSCHDTIFLNSYDADSNFNNAITSNTMEIEVNTHNVEANNNNKTNKNIIIDYSCKDRLKKEKKDKIRAETNIINNSASKKDTVKNGNESFNRNNNNIRNSDVSSNDNINIHNNLSNGYNKYKSSNITRIQPTNNSLLLNGKKISAWEDSDSNSDSDSEIKATNKYKALNNKLNGNSHTNGDKINASTNHNNNNNITPKNKTNLIELQNQFINSNKEAFAKPMLNYKDKYDIEYDSGKIKKVKERKERDNDRNQFQRMQKKFYM